MFVQGIVGLLVFQLLGSMLSKGWLPVIPGPIIGMLMLLVYIAFDLPYSKAISHSCGLLLSYLPLLLVPPAVGIIAHTDVLGSQFLIIACALTGSLLIGIPLTGWLMQTLVRRAQRLEREHD